ncbi:hypothetical protein [Micromonospora echinofusca]|uniref:hypothetical protein n=1 Tax=Micromonospora echinofusca TaxID=47858 RepID=UPI0012FD6CE4|nr:hypothetical protein [Micromonospora echinofusca]
MIVSDPDDATQAATQRQCLFTSSEFEAGDVAQLINEIAGNIAPISGHSYMFQACKAATEIRSRNFRQRHRSPPGDLHGVSPLRGLAVALPP